jgi:hypothetical protein
VESEQRPRPQYGEYASTEERLAAGGLPLEPDPPRPETRIDPASLKTTGPTPPPAPGAPIAYPWDRAITTGLLAFAAISIVTNVRNLIGFSATMREAYELSEYGEYTSTALADTIGVAILASQVVIFAIVALVSVARLRAGKRSFFVPLAGAVAAGIIALVLVVIAMAGDPALAEYMNSRT